MSEVAFTYFSTRTTADHWIDDAKINDSVNGHRHVVARLDPDFLASMRCRNRIEADATKQKKNNAASAKQVPKTKK
jgi:hypothetical protein